MRFTGRISPDKPTSPAKQVSLATEMSKLEDSTALITERSIPGSFILSPPAMFKKTSFCANLNPARFSKTANSIFILRISNPVADRCGLPYAAELTKDCVSIKKGRTPSMVAEIVAPLSSS